PASTKVVEPEDGDGSGQARYRAPKRERPPGEEEGAFPYSDSAKREYRSVSYVVGAGARAVCPYPASSPGPGGTSTCRRRQAASALATTSRRGKPERRA